MAAKILLVHNRYLQTGGEDSVYETEKRILQDRGHTVIEFLDDNDRASETSGLLMAANLLWSHSRRAEFAQALERYKPDIVHVHNIYYMIGPGIYRFCGRKRIPVVQTLHNFRTGCINGRLSRAGVPCESCLDRFRRWRGISNRCFQNSTVRSMGLTLAVDVHRAMGTWRRDVDLFIALTEFARTRHIASGIPAGRIVVKPNCLARDPGVGSGRGGYCFFAGRLEGDKGVETLLRAAAGIQAEIRIAGAGPLAERVQAAAGSLPNLTYLGPQPREEVLRLMKDAALFLLPTLAYENFPVVIAEAFAAGLPVIGSDLGATREVVEDGLTGALFSPGDPNALAASANRLLTDPSTIAPMRARARQTYERLYTAATCYLSLMAIYRRAEEAVSPRVAH